MTQRSLDDDTRVTLLERIARGLPIDFPDLEILIAEGLVDRPNSAFSLTDRGELALCNLRSILPQLAR